MQLKKGKKGLDLFKAACFDVMKSEMHVKITHFQDHLSLQQRGNQTLHQKHHPAAEWELLVDMQSG